MPGLPPAARLRRAADFAALRHAAGRWQGRHFLLRWIPSPRPHARLGLAVSRKVSPRAVVRNRIKRLVRESFRARREGLPPFDVLVIARSSAALADRAALVADLGRSWQALATLKQSTAPGTMVR